MYAMIKLNASFMPIIVCLVILALESQNILFSNTTANEYLFKIRFLSSDQFIYNLYFYMNTIV